MVKAVILDFDGTLIDSKKVHVKSFRQALRHYGLSVNSGDLVKRFGMVAEDIIRDLFPKLSDEVVKGVVSLKRELVPGMINDINPLRCAQEFLDKVKINYVLAIATSMPRSELVLILDLLGWVDYFKVLVTSYDVKFPKPAPDILFKTVKLLKVEFSDCVFIGDSIFDARCAKAAGVNFIGVSTGSYSISDFSSEGFTSFKDLCSLKF